MFRQPGCDKHMWRDRARIRESEVALQKNRDQYNTSVTRDDPKRKQGSPETGNILFPVISCSNFPRME